MNNILILGVAHDLARIAHALEVTGNPTLADRLINHADALIQSTIPVTITVEVTV